MEQVFLWMIWWTCLIGLAIAIPFGIAQYGREVRRDEEEARHGDIP